MVKISADSFAVKKNDLNLVFMVSYEFLLSGPNLTKSEIY